MDPAHASIDETFPRAGSVQLLELVSTPVPKCPSQHCEQQVASVAGSGERHGVGVGRLETRWEREAGGQGQGRTDL